MLYLKKNLNATRPSEHPPVRGETYKKNVLGGIIGCKDETSTWHFIGFPDNSTNSNIGSTVSCRRKAHRYTVHLHYYY